jgi:hypothetical protein
MPGNKKEVVEGRPKGQLSIAYGRHIAAEISKC